MCIGCYWEMKAKLQMEFNKKLRAELLKLTGGKRGRRSEPVERDDDDHHPSDVADVFDEMNAKLRIE